MIRKAKIVEDPDGRCVTPTLGEFTAIAIDTFENGSSKPSRSAEYCWPTHSIFRTEEALERAKFNEGDPARTPHDIHIGVNGFSIAM